MMKAKKTGRRKFKEINKNDLDLGNSFGQDDYDITFRNLLQEHYTSGGNDIYDYEDYSNTEDTFPLDTFKYDLKKLKSNHVSSTRYPWKRRKLSTTNYVSSTRPSVLKRKTFTTTQVSSTRSPWIKRKHSNHKSRRKQTKQRESGKNKQFLKHVPRADYLCDSIQNNVRRNQYQQMQ